MKRFFARQVSPHVSPSQEFPRNEEIRVAVLAEMRRGGKPTAKYHELDAIVNCSPGTGAWLTSRIVRNLEERIVALEEGA